MISVKQIQKSVKLFVVYGIVNTLTKVIFLRIDYNK